MTVKSSYRDMPYAEWVAIPEWPAQRNTEAHAAKILRSPLFDPNHPTLGQHCAAMTINGKTYKGNGITTTYLAQKGRCKFPAKVRVLHFYCDTKEEAHAVYLSFDASWQTKGAKDRLHSAFRVNGIDPQSPTFQRDKGTSAFVWAYNSLRGIKSNAAPAGATLELIVGEMKHSIIAVDALLIDAKGMPPHSTPAITAMLMTHRRASDHKDADVRQKMLDRWNRYWRLFIESKGAKGEASASHMRLWVWIENLLHSARKAAGDLIEIALYCFEKQNDRSGVGRRGHVDIRTFHTVPRLVASAEGDGFAPGEAVTLRPRRSSASGRTAFPAEAAE